MRNVKGQTFDNLDSNESMFFTRELEHVKSKTYDMRYPDLSYARLLPIDTSAGPGADSITYEQYDAVGVMKIIANYSDDLPRSDVFGREFTIAVKSIAGAYGYNVQEIRSALKAGKPLNTRKAAAVRKAYEVMCNNIAFFADGTAEWGGMRGILYASGTTKAAATTGDWLNGTTTPAQILTDIENALAAVDTLTNGVESINTCVLPKNHLAHLSTTPRTDNSDLTVLDWIKKAYPEITFTQARELKDVNPKPSTMAAVNTNIALFYNKSPENLVLEVPSPFEQFPAQAKGLEFTIAAHGRVAGVNVFYPLTVYAMEGI
jgi:hypothetical protein